MSVGIVLFTRDLRVHDNPTLRDATRRHDRVVPLFVVDQAIRDGDFMRPNRAKFLVESLRDLDASLRATGSGLVVRTGSTIDEVVRLARQLKAEAVHVSGDASGFAANRRRRLADRLDCELMVHEHTVFVVPPGEIHGSGSADHMSVFSAYYRRWQRAERRAVLRAPTSIRMPRISRGTVPKPGELCRGEPSPNVAPGGETEGRRVMRRWARGGASSYRDTHDDLAVDGTSRLSPYLHFGCVSPLEAISGKETDEAFVRQVCWRDFHAQVLAARPQSTTRDYRPRGDRWRRSRRDFDAWCAGKTGLPIVDAGMRQLIDEGWMHNRARLIVGHVLVKSLYLDWRWGAQHFIDLLVDGDVANNTMNWQWVAGTGTDSRYNRTYNLRTQAKKYDPDGSYVRRWLPELRGIPGFAIHEPWRLPADERRTLDYPEPIVDVAEGNRRFLHARGK